MKFEDVTKYLNLPDKCRQRFAHSDVSALSYDSRNTCQNHIFFAIQGFKTDGHKFIDAAVKAGALAVFVEKERLNEFRGKEYFDILISYRNTRIAMALCAKGFYDNPSSKIKIIGVTGTNGKTTITHMIKEIAKINNELCGIIGTIGHYIGDEKIKSKNTTPESVDLYRLLDEMVKKGCSICAMEVSSHALYLDRVKGLDIDVLIYTNLSEDHLDFHKDMDDYLDAKLLGVDFVKESAKKKKCLVINQDAFGGDKFVAKAKEAGVCFYTYSLKPGGDFIAKDINLTTDKSTFNVIYKNNSVHIELGMLGDFNIYNALSVIGASFFWGYSQDIIAEGLKNVSVPGRFQRVRTSLPFTVIVDYAHTDDALENVLSTIRKLKAKRIINVFGCGGDRETGKRYLMGEVSGKLADLTVITSDNPRTEDPEAIIKMIEEGVKRGGGKYIVISDRKNAILYAINTAVDGDVILIAGKGHEDYQILKDETIYFDDTDFAGQFLRKRESFGTY
jgi:UDP-N-acetylmuramoyl-L-alanyl-D-glutamate--2,6-diaminopimelate ligase